MCMDRKKAQEVHLLSDAEQTHSATEYRKMSFEESIQLTGDIYLVERALFAIGFRCLHPDATDQEVVDGYMKVTLDPDLYAAVMAHKYCPKQEVASA